MPASDLQAVFHFSVRFSDTSTPAGDFQEVSGLETGIEGRAVAEGGENRFVHALPKPGKHSNLVLKRCVSDTGAELIQWCKDTLEGGFSAPITPRDLTISLHDKAQDIVAAWEATSAFPVKWEVGDFDAMKNQLAIEKIELAYQTISRKI